MVNFAMDLSTIGFNEGDPLLKDVAATDRKEPAVLNRHQKKAGQQVWN